MLAGYRGRKDKPLTIEIKTPKLEALIQERLRDGGFVDINDLLTKALESLPSHLARVSSAKRAKRLVDVLMSAPFAGSELRIEQREQYPPSEVPLLF